MQQRVNVLASPEEALVINTQVDPDAIIDAIMAVNERSEAICELLVQSVQHDLIKNSLLCNVVWQLQANIDCLILFVNYAIKKQKLCLNLMAVAQKKATDIIMSYAATDAVTQTVEETIEGILTIKRYIKAVSMIANHQEVQVFQ